MGKKLNVLLIMPKVDIGYQEWPVPPVGIAYVSSALKAAGYNVFTLNLNLHSDYDSILSKAIHENNIDIIGTGGLVVNYHTIKEIVNKCKAIKPEVIVWVGGSLITFSAIPVMNGILNADIGMIGEGEITACEMMHCLEQNDGDIDKLLEVKGLVVRTKGGQIISTEPRGEIEDIDTIPYPDYDGFDYFEMIRRFWDSDSTGIISAPLTTSRSCPFNCTFCSKSGGTKYRQRSLESIFDELDYLVEKYGVNRILLNDELFANDKNRIVEFCDRIAKYNIKWFVSLRVSRHITAELLQMMKSSGCVQILYGLESGDNSILKSMRKGITAEEIARVAKLTYEAGFQVVGNFIFGDTNETLETARNTLNFIKEHIKYFSSVALSPILLFPGSYLYKKAVKDNVISNETEFIEAECPATNVSKMSDVEYSYLFNELIPIEKVKQMALLNTHKIMNLTEGGKKGYYFEAKCDCCGRVGKYHIAASLPIIRNNQYICDNCGNIMMLNVLSEYAKLFYEKVKYISKMYKMAFWGVGQNLIIFNEILNNMEELEDYELIDTNKMKVGSIGINGKIIHSPDDIEHLGIDFIIETTSTRHLEIINKIEKEYPQVKIKMSIFEVLACFTGGVIRESIRLYLEIYQQIRNQACVYVSWWRSNAFSGFSGK